VFDIELLTFLKVVIGPLLLAAGLAYGIVKYRQRGRATKALTEETTRDLYRKGAQQERVEESPPLAPTVEIRPKARTDPAANQNHKR